MERQSLSSPIQQQAKRIVTPRYDSAILKLIPLSKHATQTYLRDKSTISTPPNPPQIIKQSHKAIHLKLSHVQNVDEDTPDDETTSVIHARRFNDGAVASSVLLGRNKQTGINHSGVSRALCEVSFSRSDAGKSDKNQCDSESQPLVAYLSMRKAPKLHLVHIDGRVVNEPLGRTIPIHHGSVISLRGALEYAYLVQICKDDVTQSTQQPARFKNDEGEGSADETSSLKRKADSISMSTPPKKNNAPHQEIRKRSHQLMVGEQTCALCMDILIKSTFAIPCSHAFCAECTQQVVNNTCPSCRGTVTQWMPARSFDTIIWATALQGCFDVDDAKAYLDRRKDNGEEDPTEEERACILGNIKCDSSGYYMPSPARNGAGMATTMPTMPPMFQNVNPNLTSLGNSTNLTVNTTNTTISGNQKAGASADDAICLDSP